jgi:penicillin-binding protein 1A
MRRVLSAIAAILVVAVLTPAATAGVVLATYLFLPLPAELPERIPPSPSEISVVYDADGNQLATFKQFETSIPVEAGDIPEVLKQAVIAAEDRSFYSHSGVDVRSTLRALWADLQAGEAVQGGSTITQQLVKNTVTGSDRTLTRKIREAVLASQLDRQMDKEEILFEYLSVIYLGEGAYGVGAAAETYFRKPVSELDLSESAMLAGVIPAPSRFSPRVDLGLAEVRRVLVLRVMLDEGMITQAEHDEAVARPLWPAAVGIPEEEGVVTLVHPPQVQQSSEPYFTAYVYRWLEENLPGGTDQILRGGLRIDTTLDPRMQWTAVAQVSDFLEGTEPDLQTSLVAVEPPTGFVRAFVSGRDFEASQVNFALGGAGGGSGRQSGSAFKPFVLATAFTQGIAPEAPYSGSPHQVGSHTVSNFGGASFGTMPLRNAMWRSVNTVFTRLILDVGVHETLLTATSLGLTGLPAYDPAVHGASVALGTESVSPLDMASAFGVFAARGLRAEPTPVVRVTDREGNVLIDNGEPQPQRVLDEEVADNVTDVLRGVITSGTASGRGLDRPAAGKTGTTQNSRDAWFVGFTPTLSTAVWMGYENSTVETTKNLVNIKGVRSVTGGSHPARIWQAFMQAALADVPVTEFSEPAPIRSVADDARIQARRGFDPRQPMAPSGPGGETYVLDMERPPAEVPTTTTTTEAPTTTTTEAPTTTTEPFDPGGVFGPP